MNVLRMDKVIGDETYVLYCEERDADIIRLAIKTGYVVMETLPLKDEDHVCDESCNTIGKMTIESAEEQVEKMSVEESPEPEILKEKKAPARKATVKSKK